MATLLLDIDTQHKEMIHDAQLDYYAKKLATCSSDSTIKVYDILGDQQYQHLSDLKGHDGPVWQVAWAHPKFGVVLASCSFDGKVIIHREQPPGQWQKIFVYSELQSSVNSLAWAPHEFDLCLACVTSDGKIAILSHNANDMWSATVHEVPNGLGLNAVSWAPFGATSQLKERRLVIGGCDNKVRVWVMTEDASGSGRPSEWKEDKVLQGAHGDWVRDVAWAPSIGLPCNTIASCSEDGKVVVWTQKEPGSEWDHVTVRDTQGTPVWRVSWSITGSVLAVSAGDSDVTLWKEGADGKQWVQISDVNEATIAAATMPQQEEPQQIQQQQPQQDYSQQQPPQQQQQQQPQYGQQPPQQQVPHQQGYGQAAPTQQYAQHPPPPSAIRSTGGASAATATVWHTASTAVRRPSRSAVSAGGCSTSYELAATQPAVYAIDLHSFKNTK